MAKEDMTIIEGLKKLKMIERRMATNTENINKYAAQLSNERLYFNSETEQSEEIKKLIQANHDLMLEYVNLKARIDKTNNNTEVRIGDYTFTIASWLVILRRMGTRMVETYGALNASEMRASRFTSNPEGTKLLRFYSEAAKNDGLRKWNDFLNGAIEGRLEVINATTKLL